jgi:hypothetical protein
MAIPNRDARPDALENRVTEVRSRRLEPETSPRSPRLSRSTPSSANRAASSSRKVSWPMSPSVSPVASPAAVIHQRVIDGVR